MFRAIVFIFDTIEVAVSFFYTIEIVGVVVGAGRGQFWTGNRSFLGPEGDSGAVPEPPVDPGEAPGRPNLENQRQLLGNDPFPVPDWNT